MNNFARWVLGNTSTRGERSLKLRTGISIVGDNVMEYTVADVRPVFG